MNEREKHIDLIGNMIKAHPENFMIDKDSILYTKCNSCTEWHKFEEMHLKWVKKTWYSWLSRIFGGEK